jgi:hypothetical protein
MQIKERLLIDKAGNPTDVVLSLEEYKRILTELEELESIREYDSAISCKDEVIPFERAVAEIKRQRE